MKPRSRAGGSRSGGGRSGAGAAGAGAVGGGNRSAATVPKIEYNVCVHGVDALFMTLDVCLTTTMLWVEMAKQYISSLKLNMIKHMYVQYDSV